MQIKKLTKKDFDWVDWSVTDIKNNTEKIIDANKKTIEEIIAIPKKERTFMNTFYPLDRVEAYGSNLGHPIHFLGNSSTKKAIRTIAKETEVQLLNTLRKLYRNKELYKALKEYKVSSEKLSPEEMLFIKDTLKGFKKMGLDLPEAEQQKIVKLSEKISKKSNAYEINLNDYEDGIWISKKDVAELPSNYVKTLKKNKEGKYWVSLDYPDFGPFVKLSSNETLRKKLTQKAQKQGGKKNIKLLQELAELRLERAKVFGYKTHAEAVLEERMAKNPETVTKFLENMEVAVTPQARKDLQIIKSAKKRDLGKKADALGSWDMAYYINKLVKERYDLDTEKLREYFPLTYVLQNMLHHFGSLFGVKFKITENIQKIHKDVYWLEVIENKKTIAYVTLDFFPRPGKFTHMAMFNIKTAHFDYKSKTFHPPVVGMLGNFTKPNGKKPALLSLGEVTTLFHEFGHLMHGALSHTKLASHAGTSVSWDFVEVPSQVLQQWAEDIDFIATFGKHHETGASIPKETLESLKESEQFLQGYFEARQNFLAQYDMAIHNVTKVPKDINVLFNKMITQKTGMPVTDGAMYPAGFGHLASSYDAGYYSYKWSEVYAIDIYSEFKKGGITNKKIGKKYREEILAVGSSREEMKSLKAFLGRNPNNKAFLKKIGIKK